jgi:hypothetical protein
MLARQIRRVPFAVAGLLAGAVALSGAAFAAPAAPSVTFSKLTLINGWGPYAGSAAPAVADIAGIVTFKGAISTTSTNTSNVAFILPPGLRPATFVYIPVDMCDAAPGELNIAPTGVTQVIAAGSNADATCFTSLDGASFALSTASFTALHLRPGWKNAANGGRKVSAGIVGGSVRLAGQLLTKGKKGTAFTLPAGFRPAKDVYVAVNLCTGSIGRLFIKPSGVVTVQPDGAGNFWAVQCGVSLEGASFPLPATTFTGLKLTNGWKNGAYGTAKAGVRLVSGVVRLRGAIVTGGTNAEPFFLPKGFRPGHQVFVTADMCGGSKGRLIIRPDGEVSVQAAGNDFAEAACFTSLDGVSFAR